MARGHSGTRCVPAVAPMDLESALVLAGRLPLGDGTVINPGTFTAAGRPVDREVALLAILVVDLQRAKGVVSEGHSPGVAQVVFQHRQQCSGVRKVI